MMFSTTADFGNYAPRTGPSGLSALADRLKRSLQHLAGGAPSAPQPGCDRIREAAEVREWAMQWQRSDPGFAAELFAAADRHERDTD
jgi:hypothetical protein